MILYALVGKLYSKLIYFIDMHEGVIVLLGLFKASLSSI